MAEVIELAPDLQKLRDSKIEQILPTLAQNLNAILKTHLGDTGFSLVLFDLNDVRHMSYTTNVERPGLINCLEALIERLQDPKEGGVNERSEEDGDEPT